MLTNKFPALRFWTLIWQFFEVGQIYWSNYDCSFISKLRSNKLRKLLEVSLATKSFMPIPANSAAVNESVFFRPLSKPSGRIVHGLENIP